MDTGDPPDRRPEELLNIIPTNRRAGYDARALIRHVVDNGEFFEMRQHYAGAIITGFARLDGYSVGVVGSDPMRLAGAMDGDGADKYAHFVDLCDAFNLPMVIFLDMPGFMLGSAAERKATMRRGVRALIASAEASVPKVEFNVRKSYGVAADGPNSIGLPHGLNLRFGWPAGEWAAFPSKAVLLRPTGVRSKPRPTQKRTGRCSRAPAEAAVTVQGRDGWRRRRPHRPP